MSDDVKLEEDWAREKAAKQEAARKPPPPKSRKGLIVALVGVAVTAAMVVVVIYAGSDAPSKPTSDSPDSSGRVHIEIRSAPRAELTVDGKSVGKTPTALQFQKSSKEIVIEATMKRHLIGRGGSKDETFVETRKVTLDHDQLIDFSIKNAKMIDSEVNKPDLPEQ